MKFWKNNFYLLLFVIFVVVFFAPFITHGKLPIASDALVGLYHPWRDILSSNYPNGYPYKNPLITDPVRQQYPYRILVIDQLKKGEWPSWNPYAFSGTPLLGNIQSSALYPLNIVFWILPSDIAWSILVLFQPLLAGIFTFLYLRNLLLDKRACYLGAVSFAFCGFMVAWLTWNTIGQVALWMPLILLAKDKLVVKFSRKWAGILILSEASMLLGGHLQTALYVVGFTTVYLWLRIWQKYRYKREQLIQKKLLFVITGAIALIIASVQLWPTFDFILLSARNFDLADWHRPDWFIPWQHLLQFIAPDFFGNPATGNYWGVWNYGEFVGYIGIIPLLFAIFAVAFRRDKKTLFFGVSFFLSLFISLPTVLGKLPYQLSIPFLSTLQPSRILILVDFSLVVLAALGFDFLIKMQFHRKPWIRELLVVTAVFAGACISIWLVIIGGKQLGFSQDLISQLTISAKNFILPTFLICAMGIYIGINRFYKKDRMFQISTILLLLIITFDLLRFANKFTPFTDKTLLFPQTATIDFLQKNIGFYRFMTTDRQILPPNSSVYYHLADVDGYDPLYLKNYADVVAAWLREKPDISPAAFNRILTPQKYDSFWADILGVKYVLSLSDEVNPKLKLVFQEGETRVYENIDVFPRVYLAKEVKTFDQQQILRHMFEKPGTLRSTVYVNKQLNSIPSPWPIEENEYGKIVSFDENQINIETNVNRDRILILTDIFYPGWRAFIDESEVDIFAVDYIFRGVLVSKGKHHIRFQI